MGDPHVAALMAAFSVAMSARCNQLTPHAVEDMRIKAEEILGREHAAYPVITTFATMYEMHRRDPAALAELGEDLERGLKYATAPAPRMPERRDIDG